MTETMPPQIRGLLPRDTLTHAQRDEMHTLLSRHFEGVTREQFERDLAEKNWVVEIRRDGRLLGFSTLLVSDAHLDGSGLTAIYSGDTIVAPEAWGSPALARTWIAAVTICGQLFRRARATGCLLTSGFRTYRFLPVFWREFFPRYTTSTPLGNNVFFITSPQAATVCGTMPRPASCAFRVPKGSAAIRHHTGRTCRGCPHRILSRS